MEKDFKKILGISLLVILFFISFILVFNNKYKNTEDNEAQTLSYQENVVKLLSNYNSLENLNSEEKEDLKNSLLNLMVPEDFKDFHLNLVIALSGANDYSERINDIIKNNSWLNSK